MKSKTSANRNKSNLNNFTVSLWVRCRVWKKIYIIKTYWLVVIILCIRTLFMYSCEWSHISHDRNKFTSTRVCSRFINTKMPWREAEHLLLNISTYFSYCTYRSLSTYLHDLMNRKGPIIQSRVILAYSS